MDHITRTSTFELDGSIHRITCREHILNVAKRIKNTPQCLFLYILLMVVSVIIMLWEVTGSPNHWLLVVLETAINAFLILEVVIGVIALGSDYFHSLINCIDFGMTVLCIIFYILFLQDTIPSRESSLSMVDSILLGCRYLFQFGRLSILVYRGRKTTTFLIQADVDFSHHIDFDSANFVDHYESTFDFPTTSSIEMKPVIHHTHDCVMITQMVVKQYHTQQQGQLRHSQSMNIRHQRQTSTTPSIEGSSVGDTPHQTYRDMSESQLRTSESQSLIRTDSDITTVSDDTSLVPDDVMIDEQDAALRHALQVAHTNCICVCHQRVSEKSIMVRDRDGL